MVHTSFGTTETLIALVDTLPHVDVIWAGMGDFVIDASWVLPPRSFKASSETSLLCVSHPDARY
jgi:hypothetical protein